MLLLGGSFQNVYGETVTGIPSAFSGIVQLNVSKNESQVSRTNRCHCFKERTYNPVDAFSADAYILATSFNSLISRSFDIPKRQIIMLKMKEGTGQDELLLGLKISKVSGVDLAQLLNLRKTKKWRQILAEPTLSEKIKADSLLESVQSGLSIGEAGQKIADEMIGNFYKIPVEAVEKFRRSGLNEKEIALVFILSQARKQRPEKLVEQYRNEGKSWSAIAHSLGIEPEAAGKMILH